jgi:hypothetical protein
MNFYKMKDFQISKISILLLVFTLSIVTQLRAKELCKGRKTTIPKFGLTLLEEDCDLCGCTTSSGSSAFGDLSMSNFIGVRYIYQQYESRNGIFENSPTSDEHFNTYQIWGRVPISKNIFLNAVIPYQDLRRNFDDRSEHLNGLGDVNITGFYQFKFYKKEENTNDNEENYAWSDTRELSNHTLNIGLGVKLPTGEFEEELADKVNPGFQVGTGSWDVYPIVMYGYSNNNLGVTTTIAYYFKSENKNEYKFGNQLSYSTTMYYTLLRNEKAIKPFLGLSGDVFDSIEQFGETLVNTDGSIFNGAVGMEYATGKILLGAKYTQPLYQDLFNGNVKSKSQIALYLNFSI